MQPVATTRKRKPRRLVNPIKGLIADAATLGVHRNHLYLVLKGKRQSASLTARYQELQRTKAHS